VSPKPISVFPVINVSSDVGSSLAQLGADKGDPRNRVDSNCILVDNISWEIRPQ